MATFTKNILSGSTGGQGILLTGNSTGTSDLIHTGPGAGSKDEVWIWALNNSSSFNEAIIEYDNTTNQIRFNISPQNGLFLIVPGLILEGDATPRTIDAFGSAVNNIVLYGYTHRIA